MSSLSLCLIARDEERMLPGCLASVADVVDDVVVLDTGSTDCTAAIAREAGARVFDFEWCDDFAAARNAALECATGDWVLVLDADERLVAGSSEALRDFIDADDADGALLPLVNAAGLDVQPAEVVRSSLTHEAPTLVARLFRKTPDLRWMGRIHEEPSDWMAARPGRVRPVPVPIVHYGYVDSIQDERSKLARNAALLRLQLADTPRLIDFAYGASTLRRLGELAEGDDVIEEGWRRVQDEPDAASPTAAIMLACERAQQQMGRGEAVAAGETLDWTREHIGASPNLDYLEGRRLELVTPISGPRRADYLQRAGQSYVAALAVAQDLSTTPVLAGVTSWRSRTRLAGVLLGLGDFRRALVEARQVPPESEGAEAAALIRAEALAGLECLKEARCVLEPLPESIDKAVIGAGLSLATGREDLADTDLSADAKPRLAHRVVVLDTLRRRSTDAACPIFVGGAGRSGTTLFRAMLHAHPNLHAPPELKWVPAIAELFDEWEVALRPVLPDAGIPEDRPLRAIRACLDSFLEGVAPDGKRLVEKTPHTLCYIAALGRIYPRARFVHLVRDGRAVAASRARQKWFDARTGLRPEHDENPLAAAGYWASIQHQVRRGLPFASGRVIEVKYEELVADPEPVLRRVLAFLGEDWDPAVLEHHRSDVTLPEREPSSEAVSKPVNTWAVERWRTELDDDTIRAIEDAYGDLLDDHGYERVFAPGATS